MKYSEFLILTIFAIPIDCKNDGTVIFDNDEIYSNYPPPRLGSSIFNPNITNTKSESSKSTSTTTKPGGQEPPQMANNNSSKPDSLMNRIDPNPVNESDFGNNGGQFQMGSNKAPNRGSGISVDDVLAKPIPEIPQSLLEDKKIIQKDSRINSILQRGLMQMTLSMDNTIRELSFKYENVVFAPISIAGALALVLLGSDGQTKRELTSFMGYAAGRNLDNKTDVIHKALGGFFESLHEKPGVNFGTHVRVANSIFYEDRLTIKPTYQQLAKEFYKSDIFPLDFGNPASAQFINKWVSNKTAGKINSLIPGPLSPAISLVLANVVYFSGEWEHPFPKQHITWDNFEYYNSKNEKQKLRIEMMANMNRVQYSHTQEYQVLGLPYKGKEIYMYFILPKKSDLTEFTRNLNYEKLTDLLEDTNQVEVIYTIPKMKITSSVGLKQVLRSLNVTSMFDVSKSDLSNMIMGNGKLNSGGVCVDEVFHKVNIEITEEGTVAAASTGIIITRISKPTVRVNKPFIFLIYHQELKTILFWGSIYKPEPYGQY